MTLSLNLIKKSGTINLSKFIQSYIETLESEYTDTNLEGFIYSKEGGVIGVAFEGHIKSIKEHNVITEETIIASRPITIVKIWHQNNKESRIEVKRVFNKLKKIETSFILLNHNIRHYTKIPLSERFPKITEKGNIYSPVGTITKYFTDSKDSVKEYKNDSRGINYAKQSKLESSSKIVDTYFQDFIDSYNFKQLVNPEITGLRHFTSIIYEEDNKLKMCFMQNIKSGFNIARYIFKPDTLFCSNERLLNSFVRANYKDIEVEVKDRLELYTQDL
jgi:hypothetical protein